LEGINLPTYLHTNETVKKHGKLNFVEKDSSKIGEENYQEIQKPKECLCTEKKKGNRRRDRSYGLKIMNEMKDSEFKRMFRMSRRAFQNLLNKVSPELSVDEKQAIRGSGFPILPQTALAATIRWLAGGSYLDICALYGLDVHNF
jgi:hypothetical protein